jgi:hypothetical protein
MSKRNPSPHGDLELLEETLANDLLAAETPIETVREQLRAAGADSEHIRREAELLVERELRKSEQKPVPVAHRLRRSPSVMFGRMNKEQLVRHVNALRANPATDRVVRSRLSDSSPEVVTEEELRTLLEEFESLFEEGDFEDKK